MRTTLTLDGRIAKALGVVASEVTIPDAVYWATMDKPILLTIREFAGRLNVTERRARALAASGRVEGAVKIGRDWLIPALARVAPGTRGPRPGGSRTGGHVVLAARGAAQALKRKRQGRFRSRAMQTPELAASAVAFRLPREAFHFEEPDLDSDDLP